MANDIKERLYQFGASKRMDPESHYKYWKQELDTYFREFFAEVESVFVQRVHAHMHSGSVADSFIINYNFDEAPYQFRANARTYWMGRFNKICLDNDYIVSLYWSNGDPFKDPTRLDNKLRVHIAIMF